jgi:hypothetical protein
MLQKTFFVWFIHIIYVPQISGSILILLTLPLYCFLICKLISQFSFFFGEKCQSFVFCLFDYRSTFCELSLSGTAVDIEGMDQFERRDELT